jgi:hypothetical protein
MDKARRSTVEHYPADRLPEDARRGIDPARPVTVTVTEEPRQKPDAIPKYVRFCGIAADRNTNIEEAVARVRLLRDEWD